MSNSYFQFKQFTVHQNRCAMKVTTDSCLFGAWMAEEISREKIAQTKFLDIGTGTGLLALMIAQKTLTEIDAVEIDTLAYEQAKENINGSPWKERIQIFNADVKQIIFQKKYDFIISNPPFYENELQSPGYRKNIAHHSTELSLTDLFQIIKANLSDTGTFFLLLPYKRSEEIEELLSSHELHVSQKILVRQTTSHNYFRIFLEGKLHKTDTIVKKISIRDNNQQYSSEFIQLLKDYYLHL